MSSESIDFILTHFDSQLNLFPRKMMTNTRRYQFTVYSKEEIFQNCRMSDNIDCRIGGYPEYISYKGIIRHPPDFIFIDLDLNKFNSDRKRIDSVLKKTLIKIKEYEGNPTVIWSGNGYHIYLPINSIVLDQIDALSKEKYPSLFSSMGKFSTWSVSEVFLKYAEIFFTNGKADPLHKPKFKSCLVRIPDTYNSKCLELGKSLDESKVTIIQKWDGNRIPMPLLREFRIWLYQEETNNFARNRILSKSKSKSNCYNQSSDRIEWIEKLLLMSIDDNRRYCLYRILIPYLLNIRKDARDEIIAILHGWLNRCNEKYPLKFDPSGEISIRLRYASKFRPISLNNLKNENPELYDTVTQN